MYTCVSQTLMRSYSCARNFPVPIQVSPQPQQFTFEIVHSDDLQMGLLVLSWLSKKPLILLHLIAMIEKMFFWI